jgi:hypothetical protein
MVRSTSLTTIPGEAKFKAILYSPISGYFF